VKGVFNCGTRRGRARISRGEKTNYYEEKNGQGKKGTLVRVVKCAGKTGKKEKRRSSVCCCQKSFIAARN